MNIYTQLARNAVEQYLKYNNLPNPKSLSEDLTRARAGCFVSLHKDDELRGCIGTILPVYKNLAGEIINNAIAACQDSRFSPVTKEELKDIDIQVDILSEPELITSPKSLDPKKYGIIVKANDGRTGLLLPDLEGIDSANNQILIARQKAGISKDEPVYLYRFSVTRHKEH